MVLARRVNQDRKMAACLSIDIGLSYTARSIQGERILRPLFSRKPMISNS